MKRLILLILMAISLNVSAQWQGVSGTWQKNTVANQWRLNAGINGIFAPYDVFAKIEDGLISGGGATTNGDSLIVALGVARINSINYSFTGRTFADIAPSGTGLTRVLIVYANTSGLLDSIAGAQSNNPVSPTLPANTVRVVTVSVSDAGLGVPTVDLSGVWQLIGDNNATGNQNITGKLDVNGGFQIDSLPDLTNKYNTKFTLSNPIASFNIGYNSPTALVDGVVLQGYNSTLNQGVQLKLNPFGGFVGVNKNNPQYHFDVDGNTNISSGFNYLINGNKIGASDLDTTNIATVSDLNSKLNLTGGTLTGNVVTNSNLEFNKGVNNSGLVIGAVSNTYSELQAFLAGVSFNHPLVLQRQGGGLGVGKIPTTQFDVNGNGLFSGSVTANSLVINNLEDGVLGTDSILVHNNSDNSIRKVFASDLSIQNQTATAQNASYEISGTAEITKTGQTANTSIDGYTLANNTAATSGNQQYSPSVKWKGNYWNTSASASRSVEFKSEVVPVQAVNGTLAYWVLSSNDNGGAYTPRISISGQGNVGIGTVAPTQALTVQGSANTTANISVGGVLSVTGQANFGTGLSASAKLQINSTTQGFLPPTMTTAQFTAIASKATGLEAYDTSLGRKVIFNGTTARPVMFTDDILTAAATLDFPSTGSNATSDLTVTVTGAVDGDVVSIGVPNVSATVGTFFAFVSASNTVTVRFHNVSGGATDPASGTFKIKVLK